MTTADGDDQPRDEIVRWSGHARAHESHDRIHGLEHLHEQELSRQEERRLQAAQDAHKTDHEAGKESIRVALASVKELADLHATAHTREHMGHEQRHEDQRIAINLADQAMDKRLEGLNEFREQLREQARSLASSEGVAQMQKEWDRRFTDLQKVQIERYEQNRQRIENIEKLDVKGEGKSLGQASTVAAIVSAIIVAGVLIGILANLGRIAA